jgi:hypothetical protein
LIGRIELSEEMTKKAAFVEMVNKNFLKLQNVKVKKNCLKQLDSYPAME